MDKRPHQDDDLDASHSKRLRGPDIGTNSNVRDTHDVTALPVLAHGHYTIAWICALPLELAASRAMLDEEHRPLPSHPGDNNIYILGRVGQHNVVMASLPGQYGMNNAAIVATHLNRSFLGIRATLMVGIGGGAPGQADLRLGDVVVGTRVMQYDMGKDVGDGKFQITAYPQMPSPRLLSATTSIRTAHQLNASSIRFTTHLRTKLSSDARPIGPDRLFEASYEHPSDTPTCDSCDEERLVPRRVRVVNEPKVHYGVIASANTVMKNAKARDDIAQRLSALCFEMEAAGMPENQCLPIRGICDYSDSHKNKAWQDYAAATAAAYAKELLEALPPTLEETGRATTWSSTAAKHHTADVQALERRQHLLESLDFPQIDARKTTIRKAQASTCRWFLQHPMYQDWLDFGKQSQTRGFLWVRGKAGAGKSTMMKFIYLETKKKSKSPTAAVASFFFNARGDYLEKSIVGMYRSLLVQLLDIFPDLQSVLDDTDIVPRNQKGCPDLNVLKELFESAVMGLGQRSLTCFIDALDECDEQEIRDMVQFFEELAKATTDGGIQLRICFSSRPYPYIDVPSDVLLTLEEERGHAEDLAQYVKCHLKITDASLLPELQDKILKKAAGIFMWIVLVVDIMNKEDCHGALAFRMKLAKIPPRLSDLFRSILTRDQDRPQELLLCVLWVLCAKRPLSPAEFRHAVWAGLLEQDLVDPELPDDSVPEAIKLATSSSKGLVETTKSKKPTVQFIHESVRDFLVKENGLRELWPDLGFEWEGRSHERLRRCCTTYSLHPRVLEAINPEDGDQRGALAGRCSFLEYASQEVLHHANEAAVVIPQDDFLGQFFDSAGIQVVNICEKTKIRRYGPNATPLYILADRGLGNLIRTQMKHESAAYVQEERYKYPFFAAVANGHKDAVAALLGLSSIIYDGTDIMAGFKHRKDLGDIQDCTPLSWAVRKNRPGLVKALLEGGADPNESFRGREKPLEWALEGRHLDVASLLISHGLDVEARDAEGCTALILASRAGSETAVRSFIDKGANIEARDAGERTALLWASENGHQAVLQLLIDKGADVAARDKIGYTALLLASGSGCKASVRLLLDKGADVAARNKDGETALFLASWSGREAVARLLLNRGADVNAQDQDGRTALAYAMGCRGDAVTRLLIDRGADVNVRGGDGRTALFRAIEYERGPTTVRLLLDRGAEVEARDIDGQTALMLASERERGEPIVQLLLDGGADVNARDEYGFTALMRACRSGNKAMVRVLLDKGADVEAQDGQGRTALVYAALFWGPDAVDGLLGN